ncbi:MAG: ABC transporter permease, partial [Chloroflexi bacterium]|nr:ABC transporter permease [Chloroflexota bacterium]
TLLLVSVVTFALAHMMPGDPALAYLGETAPRDQVAYQAMRKQLGLDQPVVVQYVTWMEHVARGDLGTSVRSQDSVSSEIAQRAPVTLELTFLGMLVAGLIALPAGIYSAMRPGTLLDNLATMGVIGGLAIPDFWLGILMIYLFAVALHVLPPSGFTPLTTDVGMNLQMMVLPALAVGLAQAATLMRQIRSSLLEVLHREYVTTARAKGLAEAIVVRRHALRNAMIPVVTLFGLQTGRVFGTAVVIETIFGLPGLARLAVDSVTFRDYSALQGTILLFALIVLLINLATDLVYGFLDPRIRYA